MEAYWCYNMHFEGVATTIGSKASEVKISISDCIIIEIFLTLVDSW